MARRRKAFKQKGLGQFYRGERWAKSSLSCVSVVTHTMGGFGSGRGGGRPTAEQSLRIDLAWMLREGLAREGCSVPGTLRWNCGGEPAGSISYVANMSEPGDEGLLLKFSRGEGGGSESVEQRVRLTYTEPNFGGKRWWMICPYRGLRVGKLYLPPGGDRFASRKAWQIGYQSQRIAERDRPFEALFRLQKRLGCLQGWEQPIRRPKGMHHSTYSRLEEEYWRLDELCAVEMMRVIGLLQR